MRKEKSRRRYQVQSRMKIHSDKMEQVMADELNRVLSERSGET